jgi:Flp pilus assembly pilin Flp
MPQPASPDAMHFNPGRKVMDRIIGLVSYLKSFAREDEGQDLLEYALLIALIALVAVTAVTLAGKNVATIFTNIANAIGAAA